MAKKDQSNSRHQNQGLEQHDPGNGTPPGVRMAVTDVHMSIYFSDEGNRQFDVSALLKLDDLAEPFAAAVAQVLSAMASGNSRRTKYKDFKFGYLAFIEDCDPIPKCRSDLDEEHVRKFIDWLTGKKSARSGEPLSVGNRIHKLGVFTEMLRKLSRKYPEINAPQLVPKNPWAGEVGERNKTRPLDSETLKKLLCHIETELEYHVRQVELAPDWNVGDPIRRQTRKSGRGVSTTVWGPSSREIFLAFEYLLIYTAFNEQPLRDMSLEDIEIEEFYGMARISFRSDKARARSAVRRVFVENPNDVLSVHRVVNAVIKWTAILRSKAEPSFRDKLFLFLRRTKASRCCVGSFSRVDKKSDGIMKGRIVALSKELDESYVGPRSLRATGAQILHAGTNGDLPLVALGLGHGGTTTTGNSYRSLAVQDNEEWKLAGVMLQRERYLESKGKVDPRDKRALAEATSATPGWLCIDNMTSPIEGQRHGFPCVAYPMCPACPHSQPHPDDAYSLARTIQLYAKIQEAIARQGIRAVQARYGVVVSYLAANQARIDDSETIAHASLLKLSPLPDLD